MAALLVRDLAQIVSPAGSERPCADADSESVSVTADAYVLCDDGRDREVGRMRDLAPKLDGDVVELDGRGLCAIPGLVDCHTHACFAGDRVEEFALRAGGATYEELHAARRRHPVDRSSDARAGRDGLAGRSWSATAAGCSRAGTTTFEAKSGYGLDRETELACSAAVRDAGGVPTWLGAHAVPPEFDGRRRLPRLRARRGPAEAAAIAEAADVFLERGAFDVRPGAALSRAPAPKPGSRSGCTVTSSRRRAASRSRSSSAPDRSTTSRRPGHEGVRTLAASDVTAVLLPVAALFLGAPDAAGASSSSTRARPSPWRRTSTPAAPSARASRVACSSRVHPARALARGGARRLHGQRRARARRADRVGRIAPGYDADLVLLDAPDWRYLAYHLGADHVAAVVKAGEPVWP